MLSTVNSSEKDKCVETRTSTKSPTWHFGIRRTIQSTLGLDLERMIALVRCRHGQARKVEWRQAEAPENRGL